jgi:protein-L-isoaspartate O-methyltransferase
MGTPPASSNVYALGHENHELERLISQARFYGDLSAHLFELAGLRPGMHVLDAGCGAGDLAFLAARIVGSTGSVLGIDRSADSIALASKRAAAAGVTHVRFEVADAATFVAAHQVDAVIGRLFLMYFASPAAVIRQLATSVRADGIVTFHEFDMQGATSEPPCPLFDTTVARVRETLSRLSADTRMGMRLGPQFEAAGLPGPQLRIAGRAERGAESEIYDQVTGITRTLLPMMDRSGVATASEVGIDTLAQRMRDEAVRLDATLVPPLLIGAWARKAP